jgi:hypothetical protein
MSPGSYYVYGITDIIISSGPTHTWDGGVIDNLASNPDNWSSNSVPQDGDSVIFDGTSIKNCDWDISISVHTLNLKLGYTGTVTVSSSMSIIDTAVIQDGTLITGDAIAYGNFHRSYYSLGPVTIN